MQGIEAAQDRLRADTSAGLFPGSITDDLINRNSFVGDNGYRDCSHNNAPHLSYLGLTVKGQRWRDAVLALGTIPVAPP